MKSLAIFGLVLALVVATNGEYITQEFEPRQFTYVANVTCDWARLNLYINFSSNGPINLYTYPAVNDQCQILMVYYTGLAIPQVDSYTGMIKGDIMTGVNCFGIENANNTPLSITYSHRFDCSERAESGGGFPSLTEYQPSSANRLIAIYAILVSVVTCLV